MNIEYSLSDFAFTLPLELIAQYPPAQRTNSRLLWLDGPQTPVRDCMFWDLLQILQPGDLLVLNDTKVLPARLYGHKSTGGKVELLVERLESTYIALVQLRANKPCKPGTCLLLDDGIEITVLERISDLFRVQSSTPLAVVMAQHGHIPLPPYITRHAELADASRYQTVYAKRDGAVAAPTAGLHFDGELLAGLAEIGVNTAHVTLHVGAGTFQPVRTENLDAHVMHSEWCEVSSAACAQIQATRAQGGRVLAVGTTSVRCLETAAANGIMQPYVGETRLFIRPGYKFRAVDMLLTNFHLPHSTLLMLVCAFGGLDPVLAAYQHAVATGYRFFSYGDAMLLTGMSHHTAQTTY